MRNYSVYLLLFKKLGDAGARNRRAAEDCPEPVSCIAPLHRNSAMQAAPLKALAGFDVRWRSAYLTCPTGCAARPIMRFWAIYQVIT